MSSRADRGGYGVVVPVKPTAVAKTRLRSLGDEAREDLVAAFAADTVAAALSCPEVAAVLVVTDDHLLAAGLAGLGAGVIPDGVADDLNASLRLGAAELLRRHPGLRPAAACADLPALRPEQLGRALLAAGELPTAFVADAARVGSTVYVARDLTGFDPRFGPASRTAHHAAGATELDLDGIETVRRDVDTPQDLADAIVLGVGPRTTWAVTRHSL